MPYQHQMVFVTVHKDKLSAAMQSHSVRDCCHTEQIKDCSRLWVPNVQNFTGQLISVLLTGDHIHLM